MARGPLAGAAGPGKFSVRTDGLSLPSAAYGEGVETQAIKSGAPMASTPDVRGATNTEVRQAAASAGPVTPLFAPTQRPDEPVTSGIALGAGPGPEVLGMNVTNDSEADRARLLSYLPALEAAALDPNSSQAFRNYVRMVRANLQ